MPSVGFELTIPAAERTKTVDALDRAAAVTGIVQMYSFFPMLSTTSSVTFCHSGTSLAHLTII
jgi:hypothetical protein